MRDKHDVLPITAISMTGYFKSIADVFALLNEHHIRYIVLRNFEELENENIFIQGHPDIDLLCEDSAAVVRLLGVFSCRKVTPGKYGDGTHYYIFVQNRYVSLDLRHLGDDYYCAAWEKNLLETRVPHQSFYVPEPENLFYSLIYHAVFQKKVFSDEYRQRLNVMLRTLKVPEPSRHQCGAADFVQLLEQYMTAHGYTYVYPKDSCVPLMKRWQNRHLLQISWSAYIPHLVFHTRVAIIELLVKIKHLFLR